MLLEGVHLLRTRPEPLAAGTGPRLHARPPGGRRATRRRRAPTLTTRAALIYQHTAMERDRAIADALGKLAEEALSKQDPDGSGT